MYSAYLYVVFVLAVTVLKTINADDSINNVGKKRSQASDIMSMKTDSRSSYDSQSKKAKKYVRKKDEDLRKEEDISKASRERNEHIKSKEKLNDISFYPGGKAIPEVLRNKFASGHFSGTRRPKKNIPVLYYERPITSMLVARTILSDIRYSWIPDVKETLLLLDQIMKKCPSRFPEINQRYPFICIEGAEGSESAKIAKLLALQTGGTYLYNPPVPMEELKLRFLNHTALLKRCFFALTNYVVATEACGLIKNHTVVISRYYYSNLANFISHEVRQRRILMPEAGSKSYAWPNDLFQPDLTFYLHTNAETRKKRMFFKREIISESFAESMLEIMKNTMDPKVILLDGTLDQSVILSKIHRHMKQVGIDVTII